jgi:hypothetical protein
MGITEEKTTMESERTKVMISNNADRTDARILSNDEIDDVAGGFLIESIVAISYAASRATTAILDSAVGTLDSHANLPARDVGGGGAAHESPGLE